MAARIGAAHLARHEEPGRVERRGDVVRPVREERGGGGRRAALAERGAERGVEGTGDRSRRREGEGEDYVVRQQRFAAGEHQAVAPVSPRAFDRARRGRPYARAPSARTLATSASISSPSPPCSDRNAPSPPAAELARGAHRLHGADERLVLLLGVDELREGGAYREISRVSGEDAAEERAGEAVRDLVSQATRDEISDRLVLVPAPRARGDERLERHAELRVPREEGGLHDGHHLGGDAEHHPFGERVERAVPGDVDAPILGLGGNEARLEPERPGERGRVRLGGDPGVRPAVEGEAIPLHGADVPAEARLALDDGDVVRPGRAEERVGHGEPRDPPAEDDDLTHGGGAVRSRGRARERAAPRR